MKAICDMLWRNTEGVTNDIFMCLTGFRSVFELRKNKWLSHGQQSYNFWLSVQVFGCPVTFLVVPGAWTIKFSNAVSDSTNEQCMLLYHVGCMNGRQVLIAMIVCRTDKWFTNKLLPICMYLTN